MKGCTVPHVCRGRGDKHIYTTAFTQPDTVRKNDASSPDPCCDFYPAHDLTAGIENPDTVTTFKAQFPCISNGDIPCRLTCHALYHFKVTEL